MKRLSTAVLAALFAAGLGLNAVAAPSATQGNIANNAIAQDQGSMTAAPPADFGSPPSGQIPILFNDHHVYAKPDVDREGRVLAALVRGGTILIPLRSMFEQMGATVSYDAGSRTVDVSKPGADVRVTVGKPEVIINGESRPLDVPPILWHGHVLVPIRVISEGMGAYVQWVPDRRIVVVRYIPPTPPPTPTPATPTPSTPAPTATPSPVPTPYMDRFIAGDYIFSPKVYDEFDPGISGSGTNGHGFPYRIHGALEFDAFNLPWMIEGDYRQLNYPHTCTGGTTAPTPDCYVTNIGSTGSSVVPAFTVQSYDVDARLGIRVANPRIYLGVGYLWRTENTGYPRISNVGFGLEKLPDLDRPLSFYGSIYYYPNVKGTFTTNTGSQYQLAYNILRYDIGLSVPLSKDGPLYLEAGILGESLRNSLNAPVNASNFGPYAGIGLKF